MFLFRNCISYATSLIISVPSNLPNVPHLKNLLLVLTLITCPNSPYNKLEDRFFYKGCGTFRHSKFVVGSHTTFTDYFRKNPSNRKNIVISNCFAFNGNLKLSLNKITEQIAISSLYNVSHFFSFFLLKIK